MDKFTPEQLEKIRYWMDEHVRKQAWTDNSWEQGREELLKKLTSPQYTPREGEVVFDLDTDDYYAFVPYTGGPDLTNVRPLTTHEAGAQGLVDALKSIVEHSGRLHETGIAKAALADWFEHRGEE